MGTAATREETQMKRLTHPLFLRTLDSTKTGKVRLRRNGTTVRPILLDAHAQQLVDIFEVAQFREADEDEQAVCLELLALTDEDDRIADGLSLFMPNPLTKFYRKLSTVK
jgi:hypothetical protein